MQTQGYSPWASVSRRFAAIAQGYTLTPFRGSALGQSRTPFRGFYYFFHYSEQVP
jgi:hypothetical protein